MTDLDFTHEESIDIERSPAEVYALVSDITRTGEWSPICVACAWDEGDGPEVGAHFTGTNEVPGRTWQTRSEVVAAEPGREFAWEVNDGLVRWGYVLDPVEGGTRLTETWEFRQQGLEFFRDKYGDEAEEQIADRTRAAHEGIPVTLAAVKQIAESSGA